jgi:hypothetical protein
VVLRGHVEVTRFRGVVGCLLGDVVALRVVWEFPIAGECLAEDWVEGFLDTAVTYISKSTMEGNMSCAYGGLICHPLK